MSDDPRLARARAAFEAVHRTDPEGAAADYHRGVAQWVQRLHPADEVPIPLQLAAWCQHLRRWALPPRSDFPAGRGGYKKWRATLARQHAADAAEILRDAGFDDATIERVGALLIKRGLGRDLDTGVLEDAVCLVFLQQQLADFASKHPDDKVVSILQKTWAKMTPAGHAAAAGVVEGLEPSARALVTRALAEVPDDRLS